MDKWDVVKGILLDQIKAALEARNTSAAEQLAAILHRVCSAEAKVK